MRDSSLGCTYWLVRPTTAKLLHLANTLIDSTPEGLAADGDALFQVRENSPGPSTWQSARRIVCWMDGHRRLQELREECDNDLALPDGDCEVQSHAQEISIATYQST